MMLRRLILTLSLLFALFAGAAQADSNNKIKHVLLISVDGLHALDVANYVAAHPNSALAELSRHGVTYSNARTPANSDSFPGLLALVTGGSPVTSGVFYDVSYDRTIFDPTNTSCSGGAGNNMIFDESIDLYNPQHVSLNVIDPAKLPMSIDLGGLTAVLESYPGHSGTDIVVRVPEQNVVYAGDLLFSGWYPVCFDDKATVSGWRDTLKKFAAFDKDTLFVPGHGQICGQEGIATLREVFDDIAWQAEKMYHAGVPAEEAQHRYAVPEKFKNFPIYAWGFTIGPAITKLYAEWQGK